MSRESGIGGHHQPFRGRSDDWLTPPWIIEALGPFDLDPCASVNQPWPTADEHFVPPEDGMALPWSGFVWLNPPYGPDTYKWLARLDEHGSGIALTFARTETTGFFASVWERADAVLFLRGRLFFHRPVTGERAKHNSGGPSALIAYGDEAVSRLRACSIPGAFVDGWKIIEDDQLKLGGS